jgi:ATPase components of ABC transporters with duplicated ATPase domains
MRVFEITDLSLDFVGKSIFNKTSLMVQDSDHIGLVGPNGCGKSTFLRIILGEVIPDSWTYEARGNLKIGYLDQFADIPEGDRITFVKRCFDIFVFLTK